MATFHCAPFSRGVRYILVNDELWTAWQPAIHGPFVDLPSPGEQEFFVQTTGLFQGRTLLGMAP